MEKEGQLGGAVTRAALEAHPARSPKPAAAPREAEDRAEAAGEEDVQVMYDLREALNLNGVPPFAFSAAPEEK